MNILWIWLARWLAGERFEKATPQDYAFWFGCLLLLPVYFSVGAAFAPLFANASIVIVWMSVTVLGSLLIFGAFAAARFIPPKVSLTVAVIEWAALFVFVFFFWSPLK